MPTFPASDNKFFSNPFIHLLVARRLAPWARLLSLWRALCLTILRAAEVLVVELEGPAVRLEDVVPAEVVRAAVVVVGGRLAALTPALGAHRQGLVQDHPVRNLHMHTQ